ncbi:hypothetical protein SSBR45G_19140 [Bradyrhizobium sp. SSBR45G]|uniref:hypothetical protein n=1 Tax=unclassified Bradyrhizobium TaxID=2631580 RepID=UPI002342A2E7|nr:MULTISPECIES: hypothetical protein [unclassified Bradyrhizobium]GLH77006.1 hypothetical protein SSBR45G_19140 [Bradyrhizobium sp. SSBR45G]GLH83764.1 hypothetical protein SSBR45R_12240 [Bradyrhizobium sp. SSBR45R]
MTVLSSFEVLAETLVPSGILPPTAANPFVIQGYWVQVSLAPGASVSSVNYNVIFQETTDFTQGSGQKSLAAQFIDPKGNVELYNQFFASTGRGFLNQQISAGQTIIYGIQCIPPTSSSGELALPQGGTGWRGTVRIEPSSSGNLIATPTQRLLYLNGTSITKSTALDAVVYPVPTFTGTTRI